MIYESFDWGLLDWGKNGLWEYKTDLFLNEHRKCDKQIVAKAFVDAYNKNDVSFIAPYVTNPFRLSNGFNDDMVIDKEKFLKWLSKDINDLHENGMVQATIIPTFIKNKYVGTDVLIKLKESFKSFKIFKLSLHTFLNSVYKIDVN